MTNMYKRPMLPQHICMWFDDETLDACGDKAEEVARLEIPLGALAAVQLQEIVRTRAEAMPKTSKVGYKRNREFAHAHTRRTETAAAHPSEGGCFIVIDVWLCLRHRVEISDK